MTLYDIYMIGLSIITSLGGAAFLLMAFSSWLGKVWANRILEKDRNKYESEMESIKTENQNFINALSVSNSAYIESRKAFTTERIQAIKSIWSELIKIKNSRPSPIIFLDILTFEEYGQIKGNPKFKYLDSELSLEKLSTNTDTTADEARPFVDEKAYSYFWSYRALIGRLAFYVKNIREKGQPKQSWREDHGILQILQPIFSKEEFQRLDKEKWDTTVLLGYIETAFAKHLKELASGVDLAEESLGHSMKLHQSASALRKLQEQEAS